MGKLIVNIIPIFSHSRDRTVPPEGISQLQPNALPDTLSTTSVPLTQQKSVYVSTLPGTTPFSAGPLSQGNASPRGLDGLSTGMVDSRQSSMRTEPLPFSTGAPSGIAISQQQTASPRYVPSMPSSDNSTLQSAQDVQGLPVGLLSTQGALRQGDAMMMEAGTPVMEQDSNDRRESVISRIQSTRTGILYHSYNMDELQEQALQEQQLRERLEQQQVQQSEKQVEAFSHRSLEQPIQVYLRQPAEEYARDVGSVRSNCSTMTGTEIKRLQEIPRNLSASPAPGLEREVNDVYISKCTAIVRRDAANMRTMSLRVLPRFHNAYVENVRFV